MATRDEIIAKYTAGMLSELFVEQLRGHRNDEKGRRFRKDLVELHNSGVIDVLAPARNIAESNVSLQEFFVVQNVYLEIIPELKCTVAAMLAAVKGLVARGGNDLASGWPNDKFQTWLESEDRARTLNAHIDPANPEDATYVFLGLLAMAKTEPKVALEQAIAFFAGNHLPARLGAAKAMGILPLETSVPSREWLELKLA